MGLAIVLHRHRDETERDKTDDDNFMLEYLV
jgi:hypothetical protein